MKLAIQQVVEKEKKISPSLKKLHHCMTTESIISVSSGHMERNEQHSFNNIKIFIYIYF